MKKLLLLGTAMCLSAVFVFSGPARAQVNVQVSIGLPPPIVFVAAPEVIVVPGTYVYVVPDVEEDIFFYDGWWYHLWQERWYRSYYYDRDWVHYKLVPSFYVHVPPGWRKAYRDHDWQGHKWDYQRMPFKHVQKNWTNWKKDKHWEKQQAWGVQNWKPAAQPKAAKQQPQVQKNQDQGNADKHGKGHGKK